MLKMPKLKKTTYKKMWQGCGHTVIAGESVH